MPQPLSEYFIHEAGEFLDRMDVLLAAGDAPAPETFFRLARGVRGSAQIAGADDVARVAERLEDAARAVRDGDLAWSDEFGERARATARDLRAMVDAHAAGGAGSHARAEEALARWGDVTPGRHRGADAAPADQLVAFVRREIAGVVAELERVVGELTAAPDDKEPLRSVLRRMRPVRGVAGMESLSAVLELLEGVEDAAHEVLSRDGDVQATELDLLGAARDALRTAGRALERGEAPGQSPEMDSFRQLRDHAEEVHEEEDERDVIPISRLFFDGGGPHVVSSPKAPVASDGESLPEEVESFLRIEATGFLDRAEGLVGGASKRGFRRVARQLADLAASIRDLAGTYGLAALAKAAGGAAERLRGTRSADEAREALRGLRGAIPGAPAEPAPEPAAAPGAEAPSDPSDGDVIAIESLLYGPEAALREALAMRARVDALTAGRGEPALAQTLDELFGLIELGLERRAS